MYIGIYEAATAGATHVGLVTTLERGDEIRGTLHRGGLDDDGEFARDANLANIEGGVARKVICNRTGDWKHAALAGALVDATAERTLTPTEDAPSATLRVAAEGPKWLDLTVTRGIITAVEEVDATEETST